LKQGGAAEALGHRNGNRSNDLHHLVEQYRRRSGDVLATVRSQIGPHTFEFRPSPPFTFGVRPSPPITFGDTHSHPITFGGTHSQPFSQDTHPSDNSNDNIVDEEGVEGSLCAICMTNRPIIAFVPCGHGSCNACYQEIRSRCRRCHICRRSITSGQRIYL